MTTLTCRNATCMAESAEWYRWMSSSGYSRARHHHSSVHPSRPPYRGARTCVRKLRGAKNRRRCSVPLPSRTARSTGNAATSTTARATLPATLATNRASDASAAPSPWPVCWHATVVPLLIPQSTDYLLLLLFGGGGGGGQRNQRKWPPGPPGAGGAG